MNRYREVAFMTVEEWPAEPGRARPRWSGPVPGSVSTVFPRSRKPVELSPVDDAHPWLQMEESWELQEGMELLQKIIDKNVESLRGL